MDCSACAPTARPGPDGTRQRLTHVTRACRGLREKFSEHVPSLVALVQGDNQHGFASALPPFYEQSPLAMWGGAAHRQPARSLPRRGQPPPESHSWANSISPPPAFPRPPSELRRVAGILGDGETR